MGNDTLARVPSTQEGGTRAVILGLEGIVQYRTAQPRVSGTFPKAGNEGWGEDAAVRRKALPISVPPSPRLHRTELDAWSL